ncbi:two pore domain potassium channel family protein [Ruegeria pomeroyi]|uniref:Two pore domain potassium channel family protein n=1 Tax=Ruegeria pomeroyi TaxID=89184 RepID=A0A9Q3WLP1_9RHOB|nr:potassium channel family protein [Ruegeria pomeroyi]MCE8538391.1 two pore domain potassium channel family protein [Ruegeria pomeroyi]
MTLLQQIMWGSLYLGLCFVVEVLLLVWCTLLLVRLAARLRHLSQAMRTAAVMSVSLVFIVLAHTLQVWLWAGVWIWSDVLVDWNEALYFSLVTYTTLGYGDIVLGPGLRIFAAFAAVAGLLTFGLSTAYLVALMTRVFEGRLPR